MKSVLTMRQYVRSKCDPTENDHNDIDSKRTYREIDWAFTATGIELKLGSVQEYEALRGFAQSLSWVNHFEMTFAEFENPTVLDDTLAFEVHAVALAVLQDRQRILDMLPSIKIVLGVDEPNESNDKGIASYEQC